jgi:glycine/D-amino acid oxidase-like deaminating enzyme/nitrite reductase/ring-hydroxylating ferredoxin subunit
MGSIPEINKAIWGSESGFTSFSGLSENLHVDIAIVGAGITGLSTAYNLTKAGKKVVVLEQYQVGKGTTGSSTGNLYIPIDERLSSIESKHDVDTMRKVARSREAAIRFIEQRVLEFGLSCDFQKVPWHLFTTKSSSSQNSEVIEEKESAVKAGLPVIQDIPVGFPFHEVEELLILTDQAQFNPLKYVQQFAQAIEGENCRIFENTQVLKVEDGIPCKVHTASGLVTAEKVVMATHSPKGVYGVQTAMESYREFALAAKIKDDLPAPGVYWHVQPGGQFSVRPYTNESGNYLLVLGAPYKVGSKKNNQKYLDLVRSYLNIHFDVEEIRYEWAAQNYKPADHLPYIGTSHLEKNTYIATGFSADGLVYGTLSGMLIGDEILGMENEWASIYRPTRFTPVASAFRFANENLTVVGNLVKDYLFYGEVDELKEIKSGEGKTIKLEGEHLAAYRTEQGKLHIVSGICTHMGCVVHFNKVEKSWDCPCHGSRFSIEGKVLEGPAFTDLAKPEGEASGSA